MTEQDLRDMQDALRQQVADRGLSFTDIVVDQVPGSWELRVHGRCTDDPLLHPPADVEPTENGSPQDGPWNHRQILIAIIFTESEETGQTVLSTTVTYIVEAQHANYFPLPDGCEQAVSVEFQWEFDRETLTHGTAEMRDNGRLHYFSVLPPAHVVAFVEACADVNGDGK